jgi:uncharacterized protein
MKPLVLEALVSQIKNLYENQQTNPQIVFHGGEPLLLGIKRLRELITAIVVRVPNVSLSIQTNGTIYNNALEELLLKYRQNLTFSISVDGFEKENNRHRLSLRHTSLYEKISSTLKLAKLAGVLDNILMVVDIKNSPERTYQFMVETGAYSYNILLQDGDYNHLPPGKATIADVEVGHWLWKLFKLYSGGKQQFRIKFFDDVAVDILKKDRGVQIPLSTFSHCTMTIDTNGEIKKSDTFRININGGDKIGGENILESSLLQTANSDINIDAIQESEILSDTCMSCSYLNTCGGGYPPHRSNNGNLRNPSIYCSDYIYLFNQIENVLCS